MGYKSTKKEKIGHTENAQGMVQPLSAHLLGVATLASDFAKEIGFEKTAYFCGLIHDVGKLNPDFQAYLRGGKIHPTHSDKVGWLLKGDKSPIARFAYMVCAGHHSSIRDRENFKTFFAEQTAEEKAFASDAKRWYEENGLNFDKAYREAEAELLTKKGKALDKYGRILFSILVDADRLDTEAHYTNERATLKGDQDTMGKMFCSLEQYMSRFSRKKTSLNKARNDILKNAISLATSPKGVYKLTVPTGGGKTITGLNFMLRHCLAHGMKRIIYVAPYTSILEQNAAIYRSIVGEQNVLEHHYLYSPVKENEVKRAGFLIENWDAPVVVSTFVRFFESMFGCYTSECRKLHNLKNSVIFIDEYYAIPPTYRKAIVSMLNFLVRELGATIVLASATPVNLEKEGLEAGIELAPDYFDSDIFRRVEYVAEKRYTVENFVKKIKKHRQVLVVVNTKKLCQELYNKIGGYHLSTSMYPAHRKKVLNEVKKRLKEGKTCRLISTQVIEAGVDIDFPVCYREVSPLGSVIQAAGRVNREGKRRKAKCYIFSLEDHEFDYKKLQGSYARGTELSRRYYRSPTDLYNIKVYKEYVEKLWEGIDEDKEDIMGLEKRMEYKELRKRFHIIEENEKNVVAVVRYNGEAEKLIEEYGKIDEENIRARLNIRRKLQLYCVNIKGTSESTEEINGLTVIRPGHYNKDYGIDMGKI